MSKLAVSLARTQDKAADITVVTIPKAARVTVRLRSTKMHIPMTRTAKMIKITFVSIAFLLKNYYLTIPECVVVANTLWKAYSFRAAALWVRCIIAEKRASPFVLGSYGKPIVAYIGLFCK